MDHDDPLDEDLMAEGYEECAEMNAEIAEEALGAQAEVLPEWADTIPREGDLLTSDDEDLEDVLDAAAAVVAIDEAEREGTISLEELRKGLGR